jgi:molecular chaperone GrpE
MTDMGLDKVLRTHGVEKFEVMGEKFDPNKMNALMQMQAAGKDPNTVGLVFKSGYMIKGKVLRPADVGVVTA